MGKQGLSRGEGDSGEKEEKGSYVHSAPSTGAPSKDKLELPWAGCQTQYLSPQQPRGPSPVGSRFTKASSRLFDKPLILLGLTQAHMEFRPEPGWNPSLLTFRLFL